MLIFNYLALYPGHLLRVNNVGTAVPEFLFISLNISLPPSYDNLWKLSHLNGFVGWLSISKYPLIFYIKMALLINNLNVRE